MITFNRAKYEAKWNLSVPELQTYVFAGLLNLKDPMTNTKGIHLVANTTSAPENNASISLTLKNVTTVGEDQPHCCVQCLHHGAVLCQCRPVCEDCQQRQSKRNQLLLLVSDTLICPSYYLFLKIRRSSVAKVLHFQYLNKIVLPSHRDNETEIYKQLLAPIYGYRIRQDKYRQNTMLVEGNEQQTGVGRIIDYRALLSIFQQNLSATSHAEALPQSYENDMEVKFTNNYMVSTTC